MVMLKSVTQNKQQGVVLVVALVFLIALTAVAAALMQNTTVDIRMSGASEDKVIAVQEAVSATDEVIYKQVNQSDGENNFALSVNAFPITTTVTTENTDAVISVDNVNDLEVGCPHRKSASSIQVFTCNVLSLDVTRKYGRNDTSEIRVNAGIAQQLLNVGG